MTQLDPFNGFQPFIKSWGLLLKGVSYSNAVYDTGKAVTLGAGGVWNSASHPGGLWGLGSRFENSAPDSALVPVSGVEATPPVPRNGTVPLPQHSLSLPLGCVPVG